MLQGMKNKLLPHGACLLHRVAQAATHFPFTLDVVDVVDVDFFYPT